MAGRTPDANIFTQPIRCIEKARKDLLAYIEKKQSEQNATKAIIKTLENVNRRQADILRRMMEHSDEYFTIREISETHGVVYQTARTDLPGIYDRGQIKIISYYFKIFVIYIIFGLCDDI